MTAPSLARRERELRRLADERWDLVIVGGGIVGAGALLDAASRGLRVALVEQDDIAAGTSSRSSRLIHGGLRYLQQLQVGIVRESLAERARLLRLAPHLVRLESFLFPLYGPRLATRAFYEAGLTMYDALGSARSGGRHRHLSRAGALERAPALRPQRLRGALLYHDAMEDDARYALAVVRTALALAPDMTLAVTRVRVTAPLRDGVRVIGVRVEDRLGGAGAIGGVEGAAFDVHARTVLDATGVWAAMPGRPLGGRGGPGGTPGGDGTAAGGDARTAVGTAAGGDAISILPSRGSHLIVPRDRIPAMGGLTLRAAGRNAFLIPWPGHWIIGTTDHPYHGPVERPAASGSEVDEILGTVNAVMDLDLTRDDVVGTYAGLRPLVAPSDARSTLKVSREHRVAVEAPGLVRVSGGKYTTYRVIARDAVDAVLGPAARGRPSATADLPIVGATGRSALDALAARLTREHALEPSVVRSLVERHGTEAEAVLELGRERGVDGPLFADQPFLEAEVVWAVEHELAFDLDDLLVRRMRLAHERRDRGAAVAPRVAELMAASLGWDEARQAAEVAAFLAAAHHELDVPVSA